MEARPTPIAANRYIPSVSGWLFFFCFAGYVIFMPQIQGYDVWWHLRTGDLILSGVFPDRDILSFTAAGRTWTLHEWASEVVFIALYNCFGPAGLITLRAFIAALTMVCMFQLLSRKGLHLFLALGLTLIAGLLFHKAWGLRPHIFSLLFLTLTIYICNEYGDHSRPGLLAWLPLIFLLWINLHGGFVVGFLFLALCLIAETVNYIIDRKGNGLITHIAPLAFWSVIAFVACFANPHTYKGVLYPLLYSSNSSLPLSSVAEWHPASWVTSNGFIFFNFLVIGVFALSATRLKPGHLLLVLVFGLYAFRYHRITPFYAAVTMPLLATHCQQIIAQGWQAFRKSLPMLFKKGGGLFDYLRRRSHQLETMAFRPGSHLLPIALLTVYGIFLFSGKLDSILPIGVNKYKYPLKNIALLESASPAGNLFNEFRWGGFIAWTMPGKKVFIDGRIDVYGNDIAEEYDTVLQLRDGWRHILHRYNITHILVMPDTPLSRHLTALDQSWFLVSDDGVSSLFFKHPAGA